MKLSWTRKISIKDKINETKDLFEISGILCIHLPLLYRNPLQKDVFKTSANWVYYTRIFPSFMLKISKRTTTSNDLCGLPSYK